MWNILILLYKDILLIIRDRVGAAWMFVMPLVLVYIMTVLQDNTFNTLKETRIPILFLNNDDDSLGNMIEREIEKVELFKVKKNAGAENITEQTLRNKVAKSDYMIGIIIPAGATQAIRKDIKRNMAKAFAGDSQPARLQDSARITIYIDPTTKSSFKLTLLSSLRELTSKIEKDIIVTEIAREVNKRLPAQTFTFNYNNAVFYNEEYALSDTNKIIPNSVQHNVPAYTLFAMFFLVVSLSGNMIKERDYGSFYRLLTSPCSYFQILLSKFIVYIIVCSIQLVLMMLMGIYLLPAAGLPSLALGSHTGALIVIALSSAFAAIGYGILVGSVATTYQQAASFGAISVVILSAIGGIWVPVFAMPELMKHLSVFSPLNWGINGFYEILIRDGDLYSVLPHAAKLIAFLAGCLLFSMVYKKMVRER